LDHTQKSKPKGSRSSLNVETLDNLFFQTRKLTISHILMML